MALYLEDLERAASKGCQVPDCKHEGHDATIFIHSRCHIEAACDLGYTPGQAMLKAFCDECKSLIVELIVAPNPPSLCKTCKCPPTAYEASFTPGNNYLKVACRVCKELIGHVELAERSHEWIRKT